jgi:acyl dehydratase
MTTDWEAIHAAVAEQVGRPTTRALGRISALHFQRFAVATGETDGRYFDAEHARSQGLPGVVAPPLFLTSVMGWDAGLEETALNLDGTAPADLVALPLAGLRVMGAGQQLEFLHPVMEGQDITMHVVVDHVRLKEGKSGSLLLIELLRRYVDQTGAELVRCRETFIAR